MTRWSAAAVAEDGARQLIAANVPGAARDAKVLLAHALGVGPSRLVTLDEPLPPDVVTRFMTDIERRARRVPVSHLVGYRDFWRHRFKVTPHVLDPRPETETLVAAALEQPFQNVLDLGTGSGAILISLLADRPDARGVGTDVSEKAVLVAGENAAAVGVVDRLILPLSDWFDDVGGHYDLIVSNPPYIALNEMDGLAPELSYEPRVALTDGADGLRAYRIICAGARDFLSSGGWLMVEIGATQGADVAALMTAAGLVNIQIRQDLDQRDRVVLGQNPQ